MCLEKLHPLVSLIYFILLLIILAGSFNPVMAGIGLVSAILALMLRQDYKNCKIVLWIIIPASVFLIIIQPLFSHNGVTPLFYINDAAVTLETIVFGAVALVLLMAALGWFLLMGDIFTQEKLMYLFGRIAPGFALLFSMTLRLIPQLKKRYDEISQSRVFLGAESKGIKERAVRVSTLTEWSLEASMETAQSMEARGYGSKRRTSFHMFRFRNNDGIVLALVLLLGVALLIAVFGKMAAVNFFPAIDMEKVINPQWQQILLYVGFGGFSCLGVIPPKKRKGAGKR